MIAAPFAGIMDMDSPDGHIPEPFHKMARNIVFRGLKGNKRVENVKGTTLVPNSLLPETGVNKTIGCKYDPIRKRIYFFNYNSGSLHGIYLFDTMTSTFSRIVENGTNTNGSPLNFTPSGTIYNIDIIYGDSTQGDILLFLDSVGLPCKINVNRALDGGYGLISKSFMDVAKEPADIPPYVVYEDDASVTVNNLRKKLFKFKIRWVFDDNDKSVTSSQSEIPLPYDAFNTSTDSDPTRNCRVAIVYQTGPSNVKKVEILGALSLGNIFSDFFLIASIDKASENIPNNDIASYLFYNDKGYNYIDVEESIQTFDWVPQEAQAQCLLNGNVPGYGNVTEGYPNLTNFSNGSDTSNIVAATYPYYGGRYFSLLVASQGGKSGFGSGNVHIVVRGRVTAGNNYRVFFEDGTIIEYVAQPGDDTSSVIEGLRVDALSNGFFIVEVSGNSLYVFKSGAVLSRYLLQPLLNITTGENVQNQSLDAYDWWSSHGWGLVYFDAKGRTNGAVYTDGFSVGSLPYSENNPPVDVPRFNASIYHRPPSWSVYYQWVRTKDLSKSNIIQWISDRTLKDTNTNLGEDRYAYISIENLNTFINKTPGTPLGYTYVPNDRIRFIKLLAGDGSTVQLYNQKDFEIVSSVSNPTVNGVDYTGQFIKIRLPDTDGSFDFGTSEFSNYFIELYTPAQSVANDLNIYYEYGERYAIGDYGTEDAFHQGQLQNQSPDLTTPATFEFTKGDYYIRKRTIQTGQEIIYDITPGFGPDPDAGRITLGMTPTSISYNDPNILVGDSPFNNLIGFNLATDENRWILKIVSNTYTFRMKGTITIIFRDVGPDSYPYEFFLQKNNGTKIQLVPPFDAHNPGTYTFQVDVSFTMSASERIFIFGWAVLGNDNTRSFTQTNLTVTREAVFTQSCIDPNYSDYFPSRVNSNGRAFTFNPNSATVTYPVLMRWGLEFQRDSNINRMNRFEFNNATDFDRSKGAIMRFGVYERTLTIFQERKSGRAGIYQKFIRDNAGTNQLITTDDIITKNNVEYYAGEFGVGNQPDAVVQSGYVYYFPDPIKGKILRLSMDGITDLSEIYRAQTWAGDILPKYLKPHVYPFGGTARLTGTFNVRDDNQGEYLLVAQTGFGDDDISGETLAFDENENAFTSFYDFAPDALTCAENVLYSFSNGELWRHDNTETYTTFYNVVYEPTITKSFTGNILQKKTWISLNEVANRVWECPQIYTSLGSTVISQQGSVLLVSDFEILEGQPSASFLRDMYSPGGIIEGEVLKGDYIVIRFRIPVESATNYSFLSLVSIKYINSSLNVE